MDLSELIASYRDLSGDHGVPAFREDEQLAPLFAEAEREAAERAKLLPDKTTPAVVEVDLVEDQYDYPLHASIFDVVGVYLSKSATDKYRPLDRVLEGTVSDIQRRGYAPGWARGFDIMGEPGQLVLRLDRAPANDDGSLRLEVFRYPLVDLDIAEPDRGPEIARRHHRGLVHWVLKSVLETRDLEISSPDRAKFHEAEFIKLFGERHDANVMRQKRRHRAPRVRAGTF